MPSPLFGPSQGGSAKPLWSTPVLGYLGPSHLSWVADTPPKAQGGDRQRLTVAKYLVVEWQRRLPDIGLMRVWLLSF